MAQQNKYRDLDKNVYEIYNIKEKYTKPVGRLDIKVGLSSSYYSVSMGILNTLKVDISGYLDYLSQHIITFVYISFISASQNDYFEPSQYFGIDVTVSGTDYAITPLGAFCTNASISNTAYWLFGEVTTDQVLYRCRTSTSVSNTALGNSNSVFYIMPKQWKS